MTRSRAPFAVGDPLRGIAALAVAVSHVVALALFTSADPGLGGSTADVTAAFGPLGAVLQSGGTAGVSIFFVLSGYLLSRPFVRAFVLGGDRPSLGRYARNRLLRIVPAYWAMLVVLLVLAGTQGLSFERILRTFVFDADWPTHPHNAWLGQAWTLDVEARFYVLLPLVGLALLTLGRLGPRLSQRARVAGLLVLAAVIFAWSSRRYVDLEFPGVLGFDENVGRFMGGVALAAIEVTALGWLRGRAAAWVAIAVFVAGAIGLVLASIAQRDAGAPLGWATNPLIALFAASVVAGPLAWQWLGRPPWRALDNRVLRWAGSRSYSIYLVHLAIYTEVGRAFDLGDHHEQLIPIALLGFPASLLAAELLHRAVERPALRRRAPSQVVPGA